MNSRRSNRAAVIVSDAFQLAAIIAIVVVALFAGNGRISAGPITAAEQVRTLLWYVLVSGLASMATIEVAKRLFGLRGYYQRLQVMAWLRSRTAQPAPEAAPSKQPAPESNASGPDGPDAGADASGELYKAMGLDKDSSHLQRRWLFDLPIDQLVAQISSAVDIALADPAHYPLLLGAMSGQTIPVGAAAPAKAAPPAGSAAAAPAETTPSASPADRVGAQDPLLEAKAMAEAEAKAEATAAAQAEAAAETEFRRSQRVRSGLDQLQISVGGRWRRYVQGTALWLSGLYGILLVFITRAPSSARPEFIIGALLIGGVLSWVARDVAAVIERWRS